MKKSFVIAFLFASLIVNAQQLPEYESINLKVKSDYTAQVDSLALVAANYLLTTPMAKDNLPRRRSSSFLVKWMSGTPSYTFSLGEPIAKISKANSEMLVMYMAAMAKYCLENPLESKDDKKVKLNATKTLLQYCRQFDIKMSGELKKLDQANEKGELEKYLKV